ncbi:hypothetical protein V8E53_001654, partial [Lactarius tabidus]
MILLQRRFPPLWMIGMTFWRSRPRIKFVTLLVILTTILPSNHILALSCMITVRWTPISLLVSMRLPRPYLHHIKL